jgi:hypothetical protein
MNHRQRLLLCRLALLAFCVLPTVLVLSWCAKELWAASHEAKREDWERELGSRLDCVVRVEGVRYLPGGVARLEGLRLVDRESGGVVFTAEATEVSAIPEGWELALVHPVVERGQLRRFARLIEERLLRLGATGFGDGKDAQVRFFAADFLLRGNEREQTFVDCGGELALNAQGANFQLGGRLPGTPPDSRAMQVAAIREPGAGSPRTRWRLATGDAALSSVLAAEVVPALARLGRECQFRGVAAFSFFPERTGGELAGELTQVDLDALVSEQFPHRLSGLATVRIDRAAIVGGKLSELRGAIEVNRGSISRSLLASAALHLQLTAAESVGEGAAEIVGFRRLAVSFDLNGQSLSISGRADPAHEGILLTSAAGPLLYAAPGHSTSAVNLLRTLLPDSGYQVPATSQTATLVNLLPVPEIHSSALSHLPPHVPTRLAPTTATKSPAAVRQPVIR